MLGFAWLHGTDCLDLHGCMDAIGVAWLHGCMFDLYDCIGVLAWLHGMHGNGMVWTCMLAWLEVIAGLHGCLELHGWWHAYSMLGLA